ncbi:MAG: transglutaminase [Burkholderiales bacterium PBB3]|nr:MAG: transglutaminase [Burkholderiales bacterium PBB3]
MQLQITHETHYDYVPAVDIAQHMAYLQPLTTANQQLLAHSLQIAPEPAQSSAAQDVYGNQRQFFSLQSPHQQLTVVARSVVTTQALPPPPSSITWEQARERFKYSSSTPYDAAADFVFPSPYVPRHPDFAAYARASFEADKPLVACARDLMRRIHREFTYESQSTQINTPALEALAQRKGVCQDFAHIMVACLRALGLPARYVSGYLLTQPEEGQVRLIGSDASHAWVSAYIPDAPPGQRWLDLDPTNDRDGWGSPGEDYVTLAVGRDYSDVSPMRGVIHGGANHILTVGVTVEPFVDLMASGQTQRQNGGTGQSQSQSQSQN